MLGWCLPAIHINQVGDGLKRIETDTYRQGDLRVSHWNTDGRQLLGEETQVFEGAEDEDIARQSGDECPAACSS